MTKDFETKTENDYIFKQGRYGKSWMGIDGDSDNRYLYWNATEVRYDFDGAILVSTAPRWQQFESLINTCSPIF